jgi:hypothetical protein
MDDFSEQIYADAIPKCCSLRTLEAHKEILLCWCLCAAIEAGEPMDCTGCDLQLPQDAKP